MSFGAFIEKGLSDWELVQQTNGFAHFDLWGSWAPGPEIEGDSASVYARVIKEDTGDIIRWWTKSEDLGDYKWHIVIENVPAGGTYRVETCLMGHQMQWMESARRGDMIHHIGVGDVYVIAGQSNAAGYGKGSVYDPPEIGVHLLKNSGKWDLATHPMNDSTHTIHPVNTENTTPGHSPHLAFAKMLKRELGYPIGLIQTAKGGSRLEQWNPEEVGDLYHSMVQTIKHHGKVKGILWCQGCSEAMDRNSNDYYERFQRMVCALRKEIKMPELSFLTVQLNRHTDEKKVSDDHEWGQVREAQRQAAKLKNVFIVPSSDCKLSDGIHNSAAANVMIGERLAKLALDKIYRRGNPYGAPNLAQAYQEADKIITLEFENVNDRLNCFSIKPSELPFAVEDKEGFIPVVGFETHGNQIVLHLQRNGQDLKVHGAYQANPSYLIPTDTRTQLPMLSFYDVMVQKREDKV